ncbi:MAG: hypothetical protein LBJ11_08975 [Oscillospiraceae bacterium]|jgi:hypothetical protein|nr:hypothetical protein [Oscillospiraceae bacterium]
MDKKNIIELSNDLLDARVQLERGRTALNATVDYFSLRYPDCMPEQRQEQEFKILIGYKEIAVFSFIANDYLFQLETALNALDQRLDALREEAK